MSDWMWAHLRLEEARCLTHPCESCGSDQVQITDYLSFEYRCRMCGERWTVEVEEK